MSQVSVIVPCYNYGRFLRECVESVLTQQGVDVRILIIDDASIDDTPQVASALAGEDARVEYRRHTENRKHIATYNEGLDWASGDYTVLLSADDMLTPGSLARATRLMDVHPEVGFVYGANIRLITGQPLQRPRTEAVDCEWQIWDGLEWLENVFQERSTFIDSPEVVVRTQMYKILGGYRPELPHTADVEMWLRFAAHGAVGRVDADQAYYRVHGRNMHADLSPTTLHSLQHWNAAFNTFFLHYGDRLPDCARLQQLAAASLAPMALEAAYSPKRSRDREVSRQLIELAENIYPIASSLRGKYQAGYYRNKTLAFWAKRTLLGVPAYLYRRLAMDGLGSIRLCLIGNIGGAAFLFGSVCAHLRLIFGGWLGKLSSKQDRGNLKYLPGQTASVK